MKARLSAMALLIFSFATCAGGHVGYVVAPLKPAVVAPEQTAALRIVIMDTVEDRAAVGGLFGNANEVESLRKTVGDTLLVAYRRTYTNADVVDVPRDAGHELIIWKASPRISDGKTMMSWRAEYLLNGQVLGEIAGDDLASNESATFADDLGRIISECVDLTYTTHLTSIGAFPRVRPSGRKKFLTRGRVFKVNGKDLTISSRPDFPGRQGQVFTIVDGNKNPVGRLRVTQTYHTNFRAELLSGRAPEGAEVGASGYGN